ncbi:hypothetical protein [Streptomyces sp. NBC_00151]|uniref:hypothetical protein n=1 Tax=Streptomyces sp. NBC_00151 TaxID=2975669 RepID=UPI002DD7C306|nr:hypothetical protein [Streptomyces sp. NBC_00151]WRZ41071.1 hypothetical protein OG915_25355 [Streptomyces sp. NBC_00151]
MSQPSDRSTSHIRLLPFESPEGKTAHLITDGRATMMALLADNIETQQVEAAAAMVALTRTILEGEGKATAPELTLFLERLADCTDNVIRVAVSRGERIPEYEE